MKLLAAFLLLVTCAAHAYVGTAVYQTSTTKVRLLTSPCKDAEMVKFFAKYTQTPALAALVTYQGRDIRACWVGLESKEDGDIVFLKDGDGDIGGIKLTNFKPDPGV